jgi:hypothetical protein
LRNFGGDWGNDQTLIEAVNNVLESLSRYLQTLAARHTDAEEILEMLRSKRREAKLPDYCRETWDALHAQKELPLMSRRQSFFGKQAD